MNKTRCCHFQALNYVFNTDQQAFLLRICHQKKHKRWMALVGTFICKEMYFIVNEVWRPIGLKLQIIHASLYGWRLQHIWTCLSTDQSADWWSRCWYLALLVFHIVAEWTDTRSQPTKVLDSVVISAKDIRTGCLDAPSDGFVSHG